MAVKRKPKGFVGGGEVGRDKYASISSFIDDPRNEQGGFPAPQYRRTSSPGMQRDSPDTEPEGKRKGGLIMKKPKGYQRGGEVKDTAPGAASASSRPWSANMKGRDITMRNKGGKVNKVAGRGKR